MSQDAELVERILEGDEDAFECLYDKYKRGLYRTALAITSDSGAAEEILQDGFLRAYSHLHRVDCSKPLGPWLQRIVVNLSYNWANQRRRWQLPLDEVMDRLVVGSRGSPQGTYERGETREVLRRAIESLSLEKRTVLVLFYLHGFSHAEIAYIVGRPVGTVKSRLHHGRNALRQALLREGSLAGLGRTADLGLS